MENCTFCKIIKGEIPSTKVYEDKNTLVFFDINPVTPGHLLVVPKEHAETIENISEKSLTEAIKVTKKLTSIIDQLNEGTNIGVNNKPAAGQLVPHVHFHLIPRNKGDGLKHWSSQKYDKGQAEAIADKIKRLLK